MVTFTLFHTALSVLPIGFGFAAFARQGKIDPQTRLGKLYLGTMFAATVSSFGFLATFGFTPGQVLTLITLAMLVLGVFTLGGHVRRQGYTQTITLSASYLMLMVFATTEILKNVPLGHPFATSAADPALLPVRLALFVLFLIGVTYQVLKIRAEKRHTERLERLMAELHHA
jgi:hypothetical protein